MGNVPQVLSLVVWPAVLLSGYPVVAERIPMPMQFPTLQLQGGMFLDSTCQLLRPPSIPDLNVSSNTSALPEPPGFSGTDALLHRIRFIAAIFLKSSVGLTTLGWLVLGGQLARSGGCLEEPDARPAARKALTPSPVMLPPSSQAAPPAEVHCRFNPNFSPRPRPMRLPSSVVLHSGAGDHIPAIVLSPVGRSIRPEAPTMDPTRLIPPPPVRPKTQRHSSGPQRQLLSPAVIGHLVITAALNRRLPLPPPPGPTSPCGRL